MQPKSSGPSTCCLRFKITKEYRIPGIVQKLAAVEPGLKLSAHNHHKPAQGQTHVHKTQATVALVYAQVQKTLGKNFTYSQQAVLRKHPGQQTRGRPSPQTA